MSHPGYNPGMNKAGLRYFFAAGVLSLILGVGIGADYLIHGVPPNEEDEATTLKFASVTLVIVGGAACSVVGAFLRGKRS